MLKRWTMSVIASYAGFTSTAISPKEKVLVNLLTRIKSLYYNGFQPNELEPMPPKMAAGQSVRMRDKVFFQAWTITAHAPHGTFLSGDYQAVQ